MKPSPPHMLGPFVIMVFPIYELIDHSGPTVHSDTTANTDVFVRIQVVTRKIMRRLPYVRVSASGPFVGFDDRVFL